MGTPAAAERLIVIQASQGWPSLGLADLWAARELLYVLLWRDIQVRYRQTLLGVGWVLIQPLLAMLILTLVFNRMARFEIGGGFPYSVFVLGGLLPWTLVAAGVQAAGNSLLNAAHLISKVYFPRLLLPLAGVLVALVDLAISGLLLGAALAYHGRWPGRAVVALPIVLLVALGLALGTGLWFAALNVRYRDVRVLIPFLLQIWMYATPVAYPTSAVPARLRTWFDLNPATGVVEAFRACLLDQPWPEHSFGFAVVVATALVTSGLLVFRRTERSLADAL